MNTPLWFPLDPKPRKSYSCLDCGKEFPCPSKLQRHLLTHTGERPCFCSDCGKSFTREEHLKTHQRFHCSNGEGSPSISGDPEQAKNCCLDYTYLHTLKSHELKHTGEKSYKCSVCEKSFNQKGNLNQHMLVHTGEKPFSCSVCGKCFTQKANLTAHQLSHTGEKPFSCSICRKGFTQKAYLKQHQKLHTGEKPYACSECDKRFTFCTSLKRHQLQHTGEKPDLLSLKEIHQQSHGKKVESLSASAAEPEQHQENHKTKTSSHFCVMNSASPIEIDLGGGVHDTNCSHPSCWWRKHFAGLKLISCNSTHFCHGVQGTFCHIEAILKPCLMCIHVISE
uniref:C2H2-type domain-containing protein n=1 Tax=Salmo trutta TaxID=8032 RepID=A0A673W9K0_SALTR